MPPSSASLTHPHADLLRSIHNIEGLVKYLSEQLDWPVQVDQWEDAIYDWQPEELNLKPEQRIKIRAIKQLRPLVSNQPWGIFFVDFDKGDLPITVLRRVLNGLVPKSRVKGGGHQTWHARDLLFVSTFGQGTSSHPREIALAHFTDESEVGDIPTLRVLGWDAEDTGLQLGYVANTLQQKLRWPKSTASTADQAAWREQWASAFRLQYRQAVNDSKTLALALAELAKRIRSRVNTVLALENANGHLRKLHKAFQDNLIADLSEDGFADMFAQTITYGLFAARASRGSGALVADDAALMAPNTNPFLKELLQDFLHAGGRAKQGAKRVDFDELGINEVVTTLRDVPMDDVLRSFNAAKPGDDPVIHFYELFLKEYDKKLRAKRGVFYTPRPVVQFIVRSVDEILKTEFGIEDGLASSITWGEMIQRKPELQLPKFCTEATPFVQILDPATGTATFIVEVIEHVHAHMKTVWRKQGLSTREQWLPKWNEYVKAHLLPRLYAFELMMAPYAIAHMKIGIKLAETGYAIPEDGPRVNVFLTNALEPAHEINPGLEFEAPMLAHEAARANQVKEQLAATVVVGNPPYSGDSGNQGEWITRLMRNRLPDGADSYFRFNDADLGERNPKWVNNDYVKFIRLAQSRLATLGTGVLGYITSNSYLESATFRGVRQSLLHTLPHLRIVDLHGNSKRGETAGGDENVFEITEGVAIAVGSVQPGLLQRVEHADLTGLRQAKYETLMSQGLHLLAPLAPSGERLQLVRSSSVGVAEYELGWPLPVIAPVNSVGIVTARDELCIHFTEKQAWDTVRDFAQREAEDARQHHQLGKDARDWQVALAQDDLNASGPSKKQLQHVLYRPFDIRHTYYTGQTRGFICMPRPEVMRHMLVGRNLALSLVRSTEIMGGYEHVFVSNLLTTHHTVSIKEVNYHFPLWLQDGNARKPNIPQTLAVTLQAALNLKPADYRPEDPIAPLHGEKIFHYLYAVLHSPAYRQRYAAFLRTDFPRIPIPGSRQVFDALATLGAELVAWHLLEHPDATTIVAGGARSAGAVAWFGTDFALAKVAEKGRELAEVQASTGSARTDAVGKVFINATSGFANVHQHIWQHTIGGYQVLHKWLDDRRKAGRVLSQDDITHWLRMYAALEATQAITPQIDAAIEAHGGWPGAFSQNHPPPDAATLAAEQMAQKEQLNAQKKAASATKKKAAHTSPTGATSLFDDLEDMAAAAGEPPRPKPRATPAAAAGVAKVGAVPKSDRDDVTDWKAMCAIRAVLGREGSLARPVLIQQVARELGFKRTGSRIAKEMDDALRRAVRRGIAFNEEGALQLVEKTVAGYDEAFLEKHLLGAITGPWWDSPEVPLRFARYLGFARTGAQIEAMVWKLMARLLRKGLAEKEGRGAQARYRKAKGRG
jgi:hypothetical protein